MDAVTTIALNVLSNFVTDALKWAKGEEVTPIREAVDSTELSFPELNGIANTLGEWLCHPKVNRVLTAYLEGRLGQNEFPISDLATTLLTATQFYVPEHSQPTAEKVISTFVSKLRAAYLADNSSGILYLANRTEANASREQAQLTALEHKLEKLDREVATAGGLRPSLQTHFDTAAAALDSGDYPAAKALFESLSEEIRVAPVRDVELERRVFVNLANIASGLWDHPTAIRYYKRAAEIDRDPVRGVVNMAIADLLDLKPAEALRRLEAVDAPPISSNYEYWSAKVNALVRLGRMGEAVQIALSINVPGKEALKLQLLGFTYLHAGNLPEAESALRSAVERDSNRPESHLLLGETLFMPAREQYLQNTGETLSSELKARIDEAALYFESSANILRRQGKVDVAIDAEASLAIIRGLQGRFRDSISLLQTVVRSPRATANAWRNLALSYINCNEIPNAIEALERAIAMEPDPNTELMYVQILKMSGRGDRALQICSAKAEEPVTPENLRWHVAKAETLVSIRKYSRAREVLASVQQQFPGNPEVLLNLAELQENTGNHAEAEVAYEQALKNATGLLERRIRYQYGGFCLNQKKYSRAVDLWRPLVDTQTPNILLDHYQVALYNSRKLSEAASIAATFRRTGLRPSLLFAECASSIYERLDDLREARYWLEYLCNASGNKPKYIAQLSGIYLRLGEKEQGLELLDASHSTLDSAADFMSFAQAYSSLGKHQPAVAFALKAVKLANDPDIHMGYVGVFMAAESEPRSPEEIATYQDILQRFKERFPKSTQLQSFHVDPENPLASIRETLIKHSERVKMAIQFYKEQRLPLAIFSRFIGRDLYETWIAVTSDPRLPLQTALGSREEVAEFSRLLSAASGFVIDPIALFTFGSLGLLDTLTMLGDIFVAQRVLDFLHELQYRRRAGTPSGTIGMINGQFFMTEDSGEEHRKSNAALNDITRWVESNTKPLGLREPLKREEKKWLRPLGVPNVATLVTAHQHGLVLITDDKTFGDIGRGNFGVSHVNTQAVLAHLQERNLLSATDYDRAVLSLLDKGYSFTRVHTNQIFAVISSDQFQLTEKVRRVLGTLESPPVEPSSACTVVANLLRRLYLESIPDEIREPLAFEMLDVVARHQTKIEVQRLVDRSLRQQMSPMLIYQFRKIEDMLGRWAGSTSFLP